MSAPQFNPSSEIRRRPGTVGLIVALLASFVLGWLPGVGAQTFQATAFTGDLGRAWTVLTYPLASPGDGGALFFVLLLALWLWFVAGSVEDEDGTKGLLLFFGAFTVLGALFVWVGVLLTSSPVLLAGPSIPVAALTVLWATRRPDAPVMLMGVFPLAARWVAVIAVAMLVFGLGTGNPLIGVLAGLTCGVAWWAARQRLSFRRSVVVPGGGRGPGSKSREEFDSYMNRVKEREREREERERLRRLFEGSLKDEDPPRD